MNVSNIVQVSGIAFDPDGNNTVEDVQVQIDDGY
jgi:hypothetical protein